MVTARHTARLGTALAAVLLLGAVSACGGGSSGPKKQHGAAACPGTLAAAALPSYSPRSDELVPTGADKALLCMYPFLLQNSDTATPTISTAQDPAKVVSFLNGLPKAGPAANSSCTLARYGEYQIILGYGNDEHAIARLDFNCGTISSTGATSRIDQWQALLSFWPGVEAPVG